MGAGAVIHAVADNQDFRRYGGLRAFLPLTYSVMLIASLSLVAFPFMTGFYSKDFILESAYGQFYFSSTVVYFIATIGAMFTTLYSVKVLYLTFLTNPAGPIVNYKQAHEGNIFMSVPLIILAIFSIFFGYITKDIFIGLGSGFFSDNGLFIHPSHEIMLDTEFAVPGLFKLLPLIFTILLSVLSIVFSEFFPKVLIYFKFSRSGYNIFSFFNQRFYIELFYNKYITDVILKLGGQTTKVLDKGSIELIGPFGLEKGLLYLSRNIASLDTGVITSYALYILIGLTFYILIPYLTNNNILIIILFGLFGLLELNKYYNSNGWAINSSFKPHSFAYLPSQSSLFKYITKIWKDLSDNWEFIFYCLSISLLLIFPFKVLCSVSGIDAALFLTILAGFNCAIIAMGKSLLKGENFSYSQFINRFISGYICACLFLIVLIPVTLIVGEIAGSAIILGTGLSGLTSSLLEDDSIKIKIAGGKVGKSISSTILRSDKLPEGGTGLSGLFCSILEDDSSKMTIGGGKVGHSMSSTVLCSERLPEGGTGLTTGNSTESASGNNTGVGSGSTGSLSNVTTHTWLHYGLTGSEANEAANSEVGIGPIGSHTNVESNLGVFSREISEILPDTITVDEETIKQNTQNLELPEFQEYFVNLTSDVKDALDMKLANGIEKIESSNLSESEKDKYLVEAQRLTQNNLAEAKEKITCVEWELGSERTEPAFSCYSHAGFSESSESENSDNSESEYSDSEGVKDNSMEQSSEHHSSKKRKLDDDDNSGNQD